MTISDKTRKKLWANSGNQCAICKRALIEQATGKDNEAIVGDECHIVSRGTIGPRAGEISSDLVDNDDNLILLCKVHHKLIDDQVNTYTVDKIKAIKTQHEEMVRAKLYNSTYPKLKIISLPGEKDFKINLIESGKDLLNVVGGCHAGKYDYEDPCNTDEMELIAGFLQEAQDYGELFNDMEVGDRVRASYRLNELLSNIREQGFVVYAGRLKQLFEVNGDKSHWHVAIVQVLRITNKSIWNPEVLEKILAEKGNAG